MKDFLTTTLAIVAVGLFTISGCTEPSGGEQFSEVSSHDNEQPNQDPHAGHAHPTHGPHGGDLIELGNEQYHAELVHPHGHDDAHHGNGPVAPHDGEAHAAAKDDHPAVDHSHDSDEEGHHEDDEHAGHEHAGITIYILDGAAKNAVAIAATEITLNLSRNGKPMQFNLAASPDAGDSEGKSSRFVSAEKGLLELFHESEHVEGALVLSIGGTFYRGQLAHSHDDDRSHAHGDHKGDVHNDGGEHAH